MADPESRAAGQPRTSEGNHDEAEPRASEENPLQEASDAVSMKVLHKGKAGEDGAENEPPSSAPAHEGDLPTPGPAKPDAQVEQAGPSSVDRPSVIDTSATLDPSATKGKETQQAAAPRGADDDDDIGIGPTDPPSGSAAADVCKITLLLPNGARHPYRLDEKYLTKRNVDVPDVTEAGKKDPFSISAYTLKELILREWRDEWENKPSSPSSIRLIHFGKLLDDKDPLKTYHFSAGAPNVVHMSVRPAEIVDEEEASKGAGNGGGRATRDSGRRCCVIL